MIEYYNRQASYGIRADTAECVATMREGGGAGTLKRKIPKYKAGGIPITRNAKEKWKGWLNIYRPHVKELQQHPISQHQPPNQLGQYLKYQLLFPPNRPSDIRRWYDFAQLTLTRIRSHNSEKIAQFVEKKT